MNANGVTDKIVAAYHRLGTISGTARAVGVHRDTVRNHLKTAGLYDERPNFAGKVAGLEPVKRPLPKKGEIKRYILTSAQNNTKVAPSVWDNMLALAEHYEAEVLVGTFTYNKASYGSKSTKRGKGPTQTDMEDLWYDPEVMPYICDEHTQLAPGLIWCGEMNILPTAARPLQDLESYTQRQSGIFPHVKVAMASVASGKYEPTKFNYTTGTVTKRNYIQKKAGLKADFHHVYGGLLVEIDDAGRWFCRQVIADSKGRICDLDVMVTNEEISTGNRVRSIVWGDIHEAEKDEETVQLAFGPDGMLDYLQPEYQAVHDLLDFRARNGHTAKKGLIHDRFQAYVLGHDSVEKEIADVALFLDATERDWCETVVVDSNHDNFMLEWLRIGDYRNDPVNAIYFLDAQSFVYKSIRDNPREPINLLRWAVERACVDMDMHDRLQNVVFLDEDESFVIDGVEHGMHGHNGPNGARGTAGNLARMGRKISRGHEHSAGIHDGVYTAGLTGKLNQGYNRGPSSWSHSHIVQYANGKRAIYTMWGGKWRA